MVKVNENGILKVTTTTMHDGKESSLEIDATKDFGLTNEMVAEMT